MFKLFAIDLDWTLLNKEKSISQKNKELIKKAYNMGYYIILCSGRILKGILSYARELGITHSVIACNGSIIYDINQNKYLLNVPLELDSSIQIFNICQSEGIYFHYYCFDTMVAKALDFSSKFYFERNKILPDEDKIKIIVENSIDYLKSNWAGISKFVIIDNSIEKVDYIRKIIEKNVRNVETTKSDSNILEVMKKGVNKKVALNYLCNILGVKKEEVVALGDNENDIEMFKWAGYSIAMSNAIDELKSFSDLIVDNSSNEGVAEGIEKILLGEMFQCQM